MDFIGLFHKNGSRVFVQHPNTRFEKPSLRCIDFDVALLFCIFVYFY